MNGIIVIDKPAEFTSFDVVAVIRRITGQRKAGHTGTLDPNATGVLPVLLGRATKTQDLILDRNKAYTAGFRLGIRTDTLDIWGKVTQKYPSACKKEDILKVLPNFTGNIQQVPPMYSAVQKNGQRLYDLARKGIEVERDSRMITVYNLELTDFDDKTQSGTLSISCSKGTYIRSLIDDLGRALGTGAVMTALRRTYACGFSEQDSITLDRAKQLAENGELAANMRSVESMFMQCKSVTVSDSQARRFSNGGALDIGRTSLAGSKLNDGEIIRVKAGNNLFLGLAKVALDSKSLLVHYLNFVNNS